MCCKCRIKMEGKDVAVLANISFLSINLKWEVQHDGLTCEQFKKWKQDNNPDVQVDRYLAIHGIDCPKCNARYDLARGGCLHFTCTNCKYGFCSGCNQEFSSSCRKYKSCAKTGMHTHHPRHCLFYLRDQNVHELQQLLQNGEVEFDIEPRNGNQNDICTVQEQKETGTGLVDQMCGKDVKAQHAGLCEVHYKEYLVSLINKNHIDPAEILTVEKLRICIERHDMKVPEKHQIEHEDVYRQRLVQIQGHYVIRSLARQRKCPLNLNVHICRRLTVNYDPRGRDSNVSPRASSLAMLRSETCRNRVAVDVNI
ncbi:E3 ubiquitin-protein ligase RNF31-like [Antedon mediterranea]|uniref:E3 ubiquitin-protein ligase RNF31-like n=1 Tax=Antedon mediterranea TaxID=105859 RepID=UPI003AF6B758